MPAATSPARTPARPALRRCARSRATALLATILCMVGAVALPGSARAQTAAAGNVSLRLTVPPGVGQAKGILAFTARGIASGWAASAGFRDLATRLSAVIVVVSGGDDLNDDSYPNRCKSGEFNGIPDALAKLATAANRPELAHAPLVGIGHSHGGDYWNWFNACHPERMALVFVHASGGVNYSAASLQVPVLYELGTGDLIENGSKKPRAGMFANRSKGAPMSLVIGQGEGHNNVTPLSMGMVIELIEATFKLRVPPDADPSKGPVRLRVIDEASGGYWLGNLYTKEIAPYPAYTGNKALTAFLPSEAVALKWKETGPGLPMSIELPAGSCSWCGTPTDEPKAMAGGEPAPIPGGSDGGAPPVGTSDAGGEQSGGSGGAPAGGSGGSAGSTSGGGSAGSTSGGGSAESASGSGGGGSSSNAGGGAGAAGGSAGSAGSASGSAGSAGSASGSGGKTGPVVSEGTVTGGCSLGAGSDPSAPAATFLLVALGLILSRRRAR